MAGEGFGQEPHAGDVLFFGRQEFSPKPGLEGSPRWLPVLYPEAFGPGESDQARKTSVIFGVQGRGHLGVQAV